MTDCKYITTENHFSLKCKIEKPTKEQCIECLINYINIQLSYECDYANNAEKVLIILKKEVERFSEKCPKCESDKTEQSDQFENIIMFFCHNCCKIFSFDVYTKEKIIKGW